MNKIKPLSRVAMALLYVAAGINHFRQPRFYIRIIPPFLPFKRTINAVSGVAEIVLGALLLFPATSKVAAKGIILLLLAVFPANVYHFLARGAGMRIPQWALLLRLPMQGVLIAWAYWHTDRA